MIKYKRIIKPRGECLVNCPNCGTSNAPETNFCISCGTALPKETVQPVETAPVVAEPIPAAPAAPAADNKFSFGKLWAQLKETVANVFKPILAKKGIVTAVIGVVALLLVGSILCGIFVPTEKTPVKNLINITLEGDYDKLEEILPKDYIDYLEDEMKVELDDLIELLEKGSDVVMEAMEEEYGDDIRITFKVTEKKVLSDKKLDDIKDALKEIGISKKDVKKAVKLDIDYTIKGSDDSDEDDCKVTVVKIGSKWYALNQSCTGFATSAFDFIEFDSDIGIG